MTRRSSASSTSTSPPWARAQASRSAGEWQQQLEKHCSAVPQPHGLSMQGNGRERSFVGARSSPGRIAGSGTPEAIRHHATMASQRTGRAVVNLSITTPAPVGTVKATEERCSHPVAKVYPWPLASGKPVVFAGATLPATQERDRRRLFGVEGVGWAAARSRRAGRGGFRGAPVSGNPVGGHRSDSC